MIHSTSSILGARGKLETQSWTPRGDAKCVVGIVHGLGEHCGRYQGVAERLVREGCYVVGYDQQGHGRTGGRIPTFESLLEDLSIFRANLATVHDLVFLYGQSLGGGMVINYALQNPSSLRGVIASSPLLRPSVPPPAWKLFVARTLGKIWPSMTLGTGIAPTSLTHDNAEIEKYLNDSLVHHRVSAALGITMLDAGEWALRNASTLTVPMLLMHGVEDRVTSAECSKAFAESAGSICQLRLWDGLYHDLHFETHRDQTIHAVLEWVESMCNSY